MERQTQVDGGPLPDSLYDALGDRRRRAAVRVLSRRGGQLAFDELAASVAEAAYGGADEQAVRRAMTALHHVHLPKLSAAGVLDHDRASGTVSLTALGGRLDPTGGLPMQDG